MNDGTPARPHHQRMKYFLAALANENAERFFEVFGAETGTGDLAGIWSALGEEFPPGQRVAPDGVSVWRQSGAHLPDALVLTLPPAIARGEAYFLAAYRGGGGGSRVFCLEYAVMPTTGSWMTMLSEIGADRRTNWGPGCLPEREQLVARLNDLVADLAAAPMAVVMRPTVQGGSRS